MKAVNNAGVITFYPSLPNSFRSSTGLHLNVKGWSGSKMKDNGLFDVIIDDNYDLRIHDLGEIYWDTEATGADVPEDIVDARVALRELSDTVESEINALTTKAKVITYDFPNI